MKRSSFFINLNHLTSHLNVNQSFPKWTLSTYQALEVYIYLQRVYGAEKKCGGHWDVNGFPREFMRTFCGNLFFSEIILPSPWIRKFCGEYFSLKFSSEKLKQKCQKKVRAHLGIEPTTSCLLAGEVLRPLSQFDPTPFGNI